MDGKAPSILLAITWLSCAQSAAQEIIVTAERRAQPLDDEASSVAVLGGEDLERIGAQHTAEALNRLPGVNYHRGSGVENLPAIRSPVLNGGAGAGSFLVLEDGVPVRAAPFANINQVYETSLDFAERLEIIRGPGTVVHGSNAVHGVVNVITPNAGEDAWRAEIEVGSFGRARAQTVWTGAGVLAGLSAVHEDGWRENAGLDLQKLLLGWDGDLAGWRVRGRLAAVHLEQETAGFAIGPNAYDNGAIARANGNPEAFRNSNVLRASLAATRRMGGAELTLTPFVRSIDTDLLLHFFPSKALEETEQSGGGLQSLLAWEASPAWRVIAGADLDASSASLRETQTIPTVGTFPQGVHYDYDVDALTIAAFVQSTWDFAQHWSATLGVRGERIAYEYDNHAPDGGFGRFLRTPDREDDFSATMARASLTRSFEQGGALYINVMTGARPSQATDLYSLQTTQAPGEQGVEDIVSTELGLRYPIGAGNVSVVVYDMRKQGGAFRNSIGLTIDDTRTRHRGVELAFEAPLSDVLSASGWVAYADHTYAFNSPGDDIADGERIESAPEWTAAAQLLWRPTERTEFELGAQYVGDYITEASGEHDYPGHTVLSFRAAYELGEGAEIFGAVRNLTNTDYAERADFAFGSERYFPGEDRSFSLGVRVTR